MANSLLDFVLSLVRDPAAAARYAADPDRAIAAADLTDVTSADVQNLIPVVSESLSMDAPSHGLDALGVEPANNVWTSGAATAALDAFAEHESGHLLPGHAFPATVVADAHPDVLRGTDLLDTPESLQLDESVVQSAVQVDAATDPDLTDDWIAPVVDPRPGNHTPGLDIFD